MRVFGQFGLHLGARIAFSLSLKIRVIDALRGYIFRPMFLPLAQFVNRRPISGL